MRHRWKLWWTVYGQPLNPDPDGSWRICVKCRRWKPPTCWGRPMPPCPGVPA